MQRTFAGILSLIVCAALAACADTGSTTAPAGPAAQISSSQFSELSDDSNDDESDSDAPYAFAVIGDTPYGAAKLADFPLLVGKINADPRVRLVAHLGDIKAGKNSICSDAYFASIRSMFDGFADPLAYTPGDNEWTDCHASKGNGLYTPTERLQKIRSLFFPTPGRTLGGKRMRVVTEASDQANAAYVENTMWRKSRVVFAMLNITGSNNDLVAWGAVPADAGNYPSQAQEQVSRARANQAWLEKTFAAAEQTHAPGIVLIFQADMWDPAEPALNGFDALVQQIGTLARSFGKPVLLLEGDSHVFKVDNPYSASSALHGMHPETPVATNVTRIVIEGSDAGRTEYLRLTVDPRKEASSLFAWERVPLN
ncbi:MAG: hypothetical protein QOK07_927 [Gemmatimonadaceae bacterium]|nr:hypothetical protein [Gemmatimonadaceae bacterium]